MRQGTPIEAKVLQHRDGRTVSPYGSAPWYTDEEAKQWSLVTVGWTIRWEDGTTGIGRRPFKSKQEAESFLRNR